MSQTDESHLTSQVDNRHADGRPYHFPTLNQDDRIRKIFGLPSDAPLPLVREETLAAYHDHLVANLTLPFRRALLPERRQDAAPDPLRSGYGTVESAARPKPRPSWDRRQAHHHREVLELPLAEFGVMEDNPNCELIDDYAYWFVNCR